MPALALLWLKSAASSVLSFLGKLSPCQLLCIALALFAGVQTLRLHSEQHHSAKLETQLSKTVAAREADRQAYAKAQQEAAQANRAQVQQVEQQQQKVTYNVESDYQRKLDVLRRELRAKPAQGSAGSAGVPSVPEASSGFDGQAGVPLSDSERLRAAENELQLDELISWVEQQEQVQH